MLSTSATMMVAGYSYASDLDSLSDMGLSWSSVSESGNTATFKGWGADDGSFKAKSAVFTGLDVSGSQASFDKVELKGLSVQINQPTSYGDISTFVDTVVLEGPSKEAATDFMKQISEGNGFASMSGYGFESGRFSGMTMIIDGDAEYGTVESMTFSPSGEGDKINIAVMGQELDMSEFAACGQGPEIDMIMSMDSNKTMGANPAYLKDMANMMTGASNPSQSMFTNMKYDSNVVEGVAIIGDGFSVSIPKVESVTSYDGDNMSATSTLALSMMKIDGLAAFGLDELQFDGSINMAMNAKADTMNISSMNMDFKEQFMLDMAFEANGLIGWMEGLTAVDQCDQDALAAYMEDNMYDIDYMKMKFTDQNIMDLVWKTAGMMQGTEPDALKAQAKMGVTMLPMMAETPEERKIYSQMSLPLSKFIDQGGALTFEMRPEEGFSMDQLETMEDPNAILTALGITLSHSK